MYSTQMFCWLLKNARYFVMTETREQAEQFRVLDPRLKGARCEQVFRILPPGICLNEVYDR